MPITSIDQAPVNIRRLDGVNLTVPQLNFILDRNDRLTPAEKRGDIESAMAVAIGQFKSAHAIKDGKFVIKDQMAYVGEDFEDLGVHLDDKKKKGKKFRKDILKLGTFTHPITKRVIKFTEESFDTMIETFKSLGRKVPVTLTHGPGWDTRGVVGEVLNLFRDGKKLMADMFIRDEDISDQIDNKTVELVSPSIVPQFIDPNGKGTFKSFIQHVALGETAVIQPQAGFVALNTSGLYAIEFNESTEDNKTVNQITNIYHLKEESQVENITMSKADLDAKIADEAEKLAKGKTDAVAKKVTDDLNAKHAAEKKLTEGNATHLTSINDENKDNFAYSKDAQGKIDAMFKTDVTNLNTTGKGDALVLISDVADILLSVKKDGLVNLSQKSKDDNKGDDKESNAVDNPSEVVGELNTEEVKLSDDMDAWVEEKDGRDLEMAADVPKFISRRKKIDIARGLDKEEK